MFNSSIWPLTLKEKIKNKLEQYVLCDEKRGELENYIITCIKILFSLHILRAVKRRNLRALGNKKPIQDFYIGRFKKKSCTET
jgi:hypothetical protein